VYVSVRGDEKEQALTLHGLNAARGFIQHELADRIQTRNTPVLTFMLDRGVQLVATASAIFNDLAAEVQSPVADVAIHEEEDEEVRDVSSPPTGLDERDSEDSSSHDADEGDKN